MSSNDEEVKILKKEIEHLKQQLQQRSVEVTQYKNELIQFSRKLDDVISKSQDELRLMVEIQRKLVPTEIPQIPGFEFSKKFVYGTEKGGDYFDIFPHSDRMKFGVVLSSASSYLVSSLLLSILLKFANQIESKRSQSSLEVVRWIAEEISKSVQQKDSCQILYAIIQRKELRLNFCSAGKILGFYQSAQGQLSQLSSNCEGLSQLVPNNLTEEVIHLEPLSRLVFLSEGLLDVLSSEDVAQVIKENVKNSIHELRNSIFVKAQEISGLESPLRDQTVVVIEVKENIIKLAKS